MINKNNLKSSILFLYSLRETLSLLNLNIDKNYYLSELTDYQTLHLFITNKLPKNKHDNLMEFALLEFLKDYIDKKSIITENIIPPYSFGMSSSKEFLQEWLLNEGVISSVGKVIKSAITFPGKVIQGRPKYDKKEYKSGMTSSELSVGPGKKYGLTKRSSKGRTELGVRSGDKTRSISLNTNLLKGLAIGAAIAGILFIAKKIHNRFFMKSKDRCGGDPYCIQNAKVGALNMQSKQISKGLNMCSNTKDPEKCKNAIKNKSVEVRNSLAREKVKLNRMKTEKK